MQLSRRALEIQPSSTLAITSRAKELKSQGVDVVSFGAGEPDFPTPEHIVEAACKAAAKGETRYTPVSGIPKLREAVAASLAWSRIRLLSAAALSTPLQHFPGPAGSWGRSFNSDSLLGELSRAGSSCRWEECVCRARGGSAGHA